MARCISKELLTIGGYELIPPLSYSAGNTGAYLVVPKEMSQIALQCFLSLSLTPLIPIL